MIYTGIYKRYEYVFDEPPFDKLRSFYLYGKTGSGKTHNACAIVNISKRNHGGVSEIGLINVPKLVRHYRNISFDEKEELIKAYSKGLKIFDDIGAEYQSEFSQEFILMIVEDRWNRDLWTGFTSNLPISDLPYGDRIKSRIAGIVGDNIIKLDGKDRRVNNEQR